MRASSVTAQKSSFDVWLARATTRPRSREMLLARKLTAKITFSRWSGGAGETALFTALSFPQIPSQVAFFHSCLVEKRAAEEYERGRKGDADGDNDSSGSTASSVWMNDSGLALDYLSLRKCLSQVWVALKKK